MVTIKDLCTVLEVSADYLLNLQMVSKKTKRDNLNIEIQDNLKNSLEPLELIFAADLLPVFMEGDFKEEIYNLRVRLSKEGIVLPVVRVRDDINLKTTEFMQYKLLENPTASTDELSDAVAVGIKEGRYIS